MAKRRRYKRYPLSLYRQSLRRHRLPALLLAIALTVLGALAWLRWAPWLQSQSYRWFFSAGLLSFFYWFMALVAPAFSYVQPRNNHLRLQTPFYRLNISYRRIRSTRPIDITKTFTPQVTPRAFRRALRQFIGMTALGIDLISWPVPRWLLRFILGKMLLAPDQPGLILITRDWMALSKQLETLMGEWNDEQRQRAWHPGANVGKILHGEEKDR